MHLCTCLLYCFHARAHTRSRRYLLFVAEGSGPSGDDAAASSQQGAAGGRGRGRRGGGAGADDAIALDTSDEEAGGAEGGGVAGEGGATPLSPPPRARQGGAGGASQGGGGSGARGGRSSGGGGGAVAEVAVVAVEPSTGDVQQGMCRCVAGRPGGLRGARVRTHDRLRTQHKWHTQQGAQARGTRWSPNLCQWHS